MFELDLRLQRDTLEIGRLPLSLVLLSKDSLYPWCILVPMREGITEIHQLDENDQAQLMSESCQIAKIMEWCFKPDKMNLAALGNVVSQLHLHHVARYTSDPAWPGPIWGKHKAINYEDSKLKERVEILRREIGIKIEGFEASAQLN